MSLLGPGLSRYLPFYTLALMRTVKTCQELPFAKKKDTRKKNRGLSLISSIFVDGDVVSG
jgi:hypothetical protein